MIQSIFHLIKNPKIFIASVTALMVTQIKVEILTGIFGALGIGTFP